MDRSYTNLLSHFNRPSTVILLQSLTSSLAHYLSSKPPTSLTATAVSSPFFAPPLSYKKLSALSIAFRHAVHYRYKALTDDTGSLFTRGVKVKLRDWVAELLKGLEGGMSVLRLTCASGVLSGLDDLERAGKLKIGWADAGKGWVEDEVLVALMEVMELCEPGGWEKEFQPVTDDAEVNVLSLALILASQSIPLIQESKLKALPLPTLAHHLISTITSAFQSGSFLDAFPSSIAPKNGYKIYISPTSPVPSTLAALLASLTYESLPSVSKITARVLSTLIESKPATGLLVAGQTLGVLEGLAGHVEEAWIKSGLEDTEESDIEPDSRELTAQIWTVLKTLLFTTIMISEAVLSTTVFVPPVSFSPSPAPHLVSSTSPLNQPTPKTLALQTLQTLSHLSFVISQFGGFTTTSTSYFPELKKTFYIALDILSSGGGLEGEKLVRHLCAEDTHHTMRESHHHLRQTKKAFTLACTEQLVPILKEESLPMVFQACFPHLSDPSHRETFESAHSVMLGIFAAHAQSVTGTKMNAKRFVSVAESGGSTSRRGFVETLVPFYAGCLIENSVSGRLSTSQLRLAYSALVRSTSSGTYISSSSATSQGDADADAFALPQFCINALLSIIHGSSPPSMPSSPSVDQDHTHRLHLTLISTLPSLPLPLLSRTLTSIHSIVVSLPLNVDGDKRRKELLEELFREILKAGDREKDLVMRWWYEVREELVKGVKEKVKEGEGVVLLSHL